MNVTAYNTPAELTVAAIAATALATALTFTLTTLTHWARG